MSTLNSSPLKVNKILHKWVSLLVGIQLIIWVGTGIYFNLMDHEKASGNAQRQAVEHQGNFSDFDLLPINHFSNKAKAFKQIWILGRPYYQFVYVSSTHRYQPNQSELVDAVNGEAFELNDDLTIQIAMASFTGDAGEATAQLVHPPIDEMPREENSLWRVSLRDPNNTNIYIDPQTGRVLRHVNDDYRLRDLMFKLHFMDYSDTGGFNHWLIIVFAFGTLMLAFSGIVWVVELLKNKQLVIRKSGHKKRINLRYADTNVEETLSISTNQTLLEGLAAKSISLPSTCGGGGTCGKCKFISTEPLVVTPADKEQLSAQELKQGYRLGCQHTASEVKQIELESMLLSDTFELVVTRTQFITPVIKEVVFKLMSGKALRFRAGAYIQFHIPAAMNTKTPKEIPPEFTSFWQNQHTGEYRHDGALRCYSLANFDTESEELTFNVRWQTADTPSQPAGIGSGYLGALKVGDTIKASGPHSEFFASNNTDNKRVFLAAGSGMAPIRSIIFEQLNKAKASNETLFIFGARTEQDLLYRDDFEALEQYFSHFSFCPVLSKPSESWFGQCGYVQDVLKTYLANQSDFSDIEFYLCGPAPMLLAVQRLLLTTGVMPSQIFKDDFTR